MSRQPSEREDSPEISSSPVPDSEEEELEITAGWKSTPRTRAVAGGRMKIGASDGEIETLEGMAQPGGDLKTSPDIGSEITEIFEGRERMFDEMLETLMGIGEENKVLKKRLRTVEGELHKLREFIEKTGFALVAQAQGRSHKE